MTAKRLTDNLCRNAKLGMYWDDIGGFGLRVGKKTKTFILMYRRSRESLGRYPIMSLAEARQEAHRRIGDRQHGYSVPKPSVTFAEAVERFLEAAELSKRPRTVKDYRYHLKRHWEPAFGTRNIDEITKADISHGLSKLFDRPSEADHALIYLKGFYSWLVNNGYGQVHPCARMPAVGQNLTRSRVLSENEIRALWKATEEPTAYNTIVRLLLLTGQRRGEIAALHADWIKGDTITLPAAICKNGREHTFPISTSTALLLKTASSASSSDTLFPARGSNQISFSGWSKSKVALDKASGVQNWTLHDLRRTFATKLAALGTPQPVTEKLLNHVSGMQSGVAGIYNRHNYFEEMRSAINAYEKHLQTLIGDA